MKVSLAVMSIGRRPAAAVIPVFILLLFWLGGCGSPRPIKYYEVNYPTKSFVAPDAIGATISVRIFETSPLYLDNKMVYGFDSPELGTYEYQRWVEPPAELLQMSLVRGLRASGRFKGVYTLRGDTNSPYILGGQLYDFKEVAAELRGTASRSQIRDECLELFLQSRRTRRGENGQRVCPGDGQESATQCAGSPGRVGRIF